jgi:hypothetical protein
MRIHANHMKLRLSSLVLFSGLVIPFPADAYIDPGTTGLVTQLMYVLFYGFLGVFLFCIRYIKQIFLKPKKFVEKFLRKG